MRHKRIIRVVLFNRAATDNAISGNNLSDGLCAGALCGPPHLNGFTQPSNRTAGFTLIELIVTITIGVVLAMLAAPSLQESIVNSKTKELSSEFNAALNLAQSEAIKRGIQVSMKPKQTNENQWLGGWNIFADPNGNGAQDAGEALIQTYEMPVNGLTLVSKDAVFSGWLAFLPSGAVRGNAGISGGFRLCRADQNTAKSRQFTLQSSGNIIVDTGASQCP